MKNLFVILFIFFLTSCGAGVATRDAVTSLQQNNFTPKDYATSNFKIYTLQKITDPAKPFRIYIEGDGHAYISRTQPSSNPTPENPLLLNLISEDDSANIIYLARPCQFVADHKCEERYWTTDRFSPEVIGSIDEVIKDFRNKKIELVGYSGGAEIAIFIASKNPNVISVRTIAGNIDPETFTQYHNVTPLKLPDSYGRTIKAMSKIPQIHFIGSSDRIVPGIIAEKYMEKQENNSCTTLVKVAGASHSEGWQKNWRTLLDMKPRCK